MYNIFALQRPLPSGPPNLAERLGPTFHGLREVAGVHAVRNRALAPLLLLFAIYLGRVMRRFELLATRFEAGTLRIQPKRARSGAKPEPSAAGAGGRPRKPRVPQRLGWLIKTLGYHAAGRAQQLRHMLVHDTQMRALFSASPQAGRILRPLCRMLRIEPGPDLPPSLYPPRPVKATDAAQATATVAPIDRIRSTFPPGGSEPVVEEFRIELSRDFPTKT